MHNIALPGTLYENRIPFQLVQSLYRDGFFEFSTSPGITDSKQQRLGFPNSLYFHVHVRYKVPWRALLGSRPYLSLSSL